MQIERCVEQNISTQLNEDQNPQEPPLNELAVGYLIVIWVILTKHGNAFAIDTNTIVTCTHNIYSPQYGLCSKITFISPKINGEIQEKGPAYTCTNKEQIMYKQPTQTMTTAPIIDELAIIALDSKTTITKHLKLGKLPNNAQKVKLRMIAYSSKQYSMDEERTFIRVDLQGQLHSLNGHIINHTMKTSAGHSGSPIIAQDSNGRQYIVGIHTHKGLEDSYNSGLYFTQQVMQTAEMFYQKLNQNRNNQTTSIFHESLSSQNYDEQQSNSTMRASLYFDKSQQNQSQSSEQIQAKQYSYSSQQSIQSNSSYAQMQKFFFGEEQIDGDQNREWQKFPQQFLDLLTQLLTEQLVSLRQI